MIHETAVIGPGVKLGEDIHIGPYTVIEDEVNVGDGCRIGPRVYINGWTTIGKNVKIHANAVVGDDPQDYHYNGDKSYCLIGDNTIIREYVTIHRGEGKGTKTSIGSGCMLMAFVHVGHNVTMGNNCTLGNHTVLSGHVTVEDRANLSGYVGVHQFSNVGTLSMTGPYSRVTHDVPPYCLIIDGAVFSVNLVGLRRGGITSETIKTIREAVQTIFFSKMLRKEALAKVESESGDIPEVAHLIKFIRKSKRGLLQGHRG
ncbi:MAG: acyl-ACP--UDP-N-acetylglucosamine O-acyltransferase [Deltaproteobacteria bacterium]|nr:acyl-ACP--UDP-N-acetylglucosamine O-acyltransferase [Deltaproteobacteria bacterium]